MKYLTLSATALLVLTCTTSQAGEHYVQYGMYGHPSLAGAYCSGYRANVCWPAQFVPAARRSVLSAYDVITNNGWRRQNLLGAYHFDPDTNELTEAGKLKVKWILSQAPVHRRSIFVERGADQSQTASRVASVHSWTGGMSPMVDSVDVNDTHIVAEGHSAGAVDNVFVGFQTNQRPPVLPPEGSSSGGSTAAQ